MGSHNGSIDTVLLTPPSLDILQYFLNEKALIWICFYFEYR